MGTIAWVMLSAAVTTASPSSQAVSEKERGDRLAANGDTSGALDAYNTALKLAPGYAAALNGIGFLYAAENPDEALSWFKKAIASEPDFALSYNNAGYLYRKTSKWNEAVEAYKKYLSLEKSDMAGYFGLAEAYRGGGMKKEALAAYEDYLARDTSSSNQKRIDKAKGFAEELRKQLGVEAPPVQAAAPAPATTPAATAPAAGAVTAVAGAAVGAAAATTTTTTTTTTAAPAGATAAAPAAATSSVAPEKAAFAKQRVTEGLSLRAANKGRDSLFAFQDAANADPSNVQAVFELGNAYAAMNYYPQAIERWQKVLTLANADAATKTQAEQNIASAQAKLGGNKPAATATAAVATTPAATATPAAAAAPASAPNAATPTPASTTTAAAALPPPPGMNDAQTAYTEGVGLYTQQKYAEAVQAFSRAITAKADFPQAFAARGSAQYALRDYPNALNDYAQAMRLDNKLASPVFGVAETLNALGRKTDAVPYYEAYAVSQAPDAQASLQALAKQRVAEIRK